MNSCTGGQFEILFWDQFPTSVRPLCLLIQCSSGLGWPETLQDTDTRSPTDTLCCSVDTNTSGASEIHTTSGLHRHRSQAQAGRQSTHELTKHVEHYDAAALAYLVYGGADVLPVV